MPQSGDARFNKETVMTNTDLNMMGMMKEHMRRCRLCAFVPVAFGVVFFLLGYFLDAEVVRILWLILTGMMVLMGIFMVIMVNAFFR